MGSTPSTPTSGSPLPCLSPPLMQTSPQNNSSNSETEAKPVLPADEERLRSYEHVRENVYLTER